jgi:hypothetical protein
MYDFLNITHWKYKKIMAAIHIQNSQRVSHTYEKVINIYDAMLYLSNSG